MVGESIQVVTVCGTSRPGNYTSKALSLVEQELQVMGIPFRRFDPSLVSLSFPGTDGDTRGRSLLHEMLETATAVVLATPEYHGSFSGCLKLIIENLGFPSRLSGLPIVLLGVAAGEIGAVKSLEHLRSVCSHVGAIVLPGSVSVARVQQVFDEEGHCRDARVEKRIRGLAKNLVDYIRRNICPRLALESQVRGQD